MGSEDIVHLEDFQKVSHLTLKLKEHSYVPTGSVGKWDSSLMTLYGFLGNLKNWKSESLSTLGQGSFRLLEEIYDDGGATVQCMFSVGLAGIPSDKT